MVLALLDEELGRASATQTTCMFEQNLGFAGVHLPEDDDVVGVGLYTNQY